MNRRPFDLNKLRDWASDHGISISITYWDGDDTYEIETYSASDDECFKLKRCYDPDFFIKLWTENLQSRINKRHD